MSEPMHLLQINDTLRVAAYFDYDAEHPAAWGVEFVQTLRTARGMSELTTDDGHREAIREIMEHNPETTTRGSSWQTTRRDDWERDAITKHLNRAGFDCTFIQLIGGSPSEWADIVAYWNAGDITNPEAVAREWRAWYAGEVYWLALECADIYTNAAGNTITTWQTVDTVGGIYLTDGLTRETADLYFDITAATVAA